MSLSIGCEPGWILDPESSIIMMACVRPYPILFCNVLLRVYGFSSRSCITLTNPIMQLKRLVLSVANPKSNQIYIKYKFERRWDKNHLSHCITSSREGSYDSHDYYYGYDNRVNEVKECMILFNRNFFFLFFARYSFFNFDLFFRHQRKIYPPLWS